MTRKLSGWGWAGVGAIAVLLIAWAGSSIYTLLKQHSEDERVTRIERVVVGLQRNHRVRGNLPVRKGVVPQQPHGSAHQQPGPHSGGGGNGHIESGGSVPERVPHTAPSGTPPPGNESVSPPAHPAPEVGPAPATEATHPVTEAAGHLVEETGGTVNEAVGGVTCTLHLSC